MNNNELYFEWWLDELKENDCIVSYKSQPQTFTLREQYAIDYKEKVKSKEYNIFQSIEYTPDYEVIFTDKLLNKLFYDIEEPITINPRKKFIGTKIETGYKVYFDCKPPSKVLAFSKFAGSSREFPIKQRLMFELYDIYVNRVVPYGSATSLFCNTFIPKRYLLTDKTLKPRKLKNYEVKCSSIDEYLL